MYDVTISLQPLVVCLCTAPWVVVHQHDARLAPLDGFLAFVFVSDDEFLLGT